MAVPYGMPQPYVMAPPTPLFGLPAEPAADPGIGQWVIIALLIVQIAIMLSSLGVVVFPLLQNKLHRDRSV